MGDFEPLRPELYRYCRHLTRSPWDAEDLAQDTLARALVTLASTSETPVNPRAWLFRVASNLWLNRVRQASLAAALVDDAVDPPAPAELRVTREAAGTLLASLSPQERAAVVLKDAFDFSLEEISLTLSTTVGAVKAALHRGRGKLTSLEPDQPRAPAPAVLDAFCEAFNARDLDRLTALLLDSARLEYPGLKVEAGAAEVRDGSLRGTLFGCPELGYEPPAPPRCELRAHRGAWLFLWWVGAEVHALVRVEVRQDRIALLRNYYHAPEVLTEVCGELQVPVRTHGHHLAA